MCMFCRLLFVLLYFSFLAIVLSVLLRYTDSDYPFGIFKLIYTITTFYLSFYRNQDADWWNINAYNLNKVMPNTLHYIVTRDNISMFINIKPSWLKASIKNVLLWWKFDEDKQIGFGMMKDKWQRTPWPFNSSLHFSHPIIQSITG